MAPTWLVGVSTRSIFRQKGSGLSGLFEPHREKTSCENKDAEIGKHLIWISAEVLAYIHMRTFFKQNPPLTFGRAMLLKSEFDILDLAMRLVRNWLYFLADLCHCVLIMVKADAVTRRFKYEKICL